MEPSKKTKKGFESSNERGRSGQKTSVFRKSRDGTGEVRLLPVRVVEDGPTKAFPEASQSNYRPDNGQEINTSQRTGQEMRADVRADPDTTLACFEVVLTNDRRVVVPQTFDPHRLRVLLAVLDA